MAETRQARGRRRPRWVALRGAVAVLCLGYVAWPRAVSAQTCVSTGSRADPPAECCNEGEYDCNSHYCLVSPSYTLDSQGNCCKPGAEFRDCAGVCKSTCSSNANGCAGSCDCNILSCDDQCSGPNTNRAVGPRWDSSSPSPQCCLESDRDCSDICNGEAIIDCTGVCGGGSTGREALLVDPCGRCGGDGSTCADACGVPNGDGTSCAGCDGVPNSGLTLDECDVCDGNARDGNDYSGRPDLCALNKCDISAPSNGQLGTCASEMLVGESCTLECDPGYSSNQLTLTCRLDARVEPLPAMRTLSLSANPICTPDPCTVSAPANGQTGTCGSMLQHGESCAMTCDDGYSLTGDQPACFAGSLTNMPTCQGHPCDGAHAVPRPANGAMGSCRWDGYLEHGESCNVICLDGFSLSGEQASCAGGVLTFSVSCTPQNCSEVIDLPINGNSGTCPYNHTSGVIAMQHGEQCEFGCADGYYVTGSQPACESGTLSHTVYCEGNPCDLPMLENGYSGNCPRTEPLRHGRTCEPLCNDGYHRVGTSPSCNLGVLTSSAACKPDDCDETIVAPENGHLGTCVGILSKLNHSFSCELGCDTGFEMVGEQPSCSAGTLTSSFECRSPPEPEPEPEPEPPEPEPEPEPEPAPLWATNVQCGHRKCLDGVHERGYVFEEHSWWWTECLEPPDCAGVCGGENTLDDNGECCSLIDRDCRGFCTHSFFLDACGVCDGPGEGIWHRDIDGDGMGDPDATVSACAQPQGYVPNADDDCDGVRDCAGVCNGRTEFDCQDSGGVSQSGVWGEPLCGGIDGEMRLVDSVGFCCLPFDESMPGNWRARQDCNGICGGTWQLDCAGICGPRYPPLHVEDDAGMCCLPSEIDCSNECHGGREIDCSGHCGGDDIMCIDCAGTLHGSATVDHCGVCDSDATNDCTLDCLGVWGGEQQRDECNFCINSTQTTSCRDCNDTLFGANLTQTTSCRDCNGTLFGANSAQRTSCRDCNGTIHGTMYVNQCDECVRPGSVEEQDCAMDCLGVWGGDAVVDDCGVCDGDGRLCMFNDVSTSVTVDFLGPVDADRFETALSDSIATSITADTDGAPFVNTTSYVQSVVSSLALPGNIDDFDISTEVGRLWRNVLFGQVRMAVAVVLEVPVEFVRITGIADDTPFAATDQAGRRTQEEYRTDASSNDYMSGRTQDRRRLGGTNNTISIAYEVSSDHDLSSNIKSRLRSNLVSQEMSMAGLASFSDVYQQLYSDPPDCEPFNGCGGRYLCEDCVPLASEDVGIRFPVLTTNLSLVVEVQTGEAVEMAPAIVDQLRNSEVIRAASRTAGCVSCTVTALGVAEPDVVVPDCAGTLDGSAALDQCGVCGGNSTCLDCAGVPNGDHIIDMCGNCTARTSKCKRDCSGKWGGSRVYDSCGVCGGDDSKCNTKRDCFGNWGGGQVVDACGVCGGLNRSCADICGVPHGDTRTCQGCDGIPLSGSVYDACDVCAGDNTTCAGCDGIPYSGLVLDVCGVCDGEEMCNIRGEALLFLMQVCETPPTTVNGVLTCEQSSDDADSDESTASWAEELEASESPVFLVSPASHVEPGQEDARGYPRTETINSMRVFEQSFMLDLASALQIPEARIEVVSATQLSRTYFVIDFELKPDRSSDRSPTQLAGQVEALRLAGTLHDQSWLFSHIQRRVGAPTPPASVPAATPGSPPTPTPDALSEVDLQSMIAHEHAGEGDMFGSSLALSMFTAVVGSPGRDSAIVFRKLFSLDGTITWEEEATLAPGVGNSLDASFGTEVAVANTDAGVVALVGTNGGLLQAGRAYCFARVNGMWSEPTELIAQAPVQDGFGTAVGISNGVAVVGASSNAGGCAYVFADLGGSWTQVAVLNGNGTLPSDNFGASVAISSATIVVGAPNRTLGAGSAYIFSQVQGVWTEQAQIQPTDIVRKFGISIAVAGDTILVGAPGDPNTPGFVYAYVRREYGWVQHAKFASCNPSKADGFGISVAVSGLTAAVGSYSRMTHIFVRNGDVWARKVPLTRNTSESFGHTVALDGSTILVGAPLDRRAVGSVYLYSDLRERDEWNCPPTDHLLSEPEPELVEPEPAPDVEPEPDPADDFIGVWVTSGWPPCPLTCGPRGSVTRSVICTVNDIVATNDRCTATKPATSRECATQSIGAACDDGDELTMGDKCMSELASSCTGRVNLFAALRYDVAFDENDVASLVDENYAVDESPISVELKQKLATTLSASGMSCTAQDITILSIVAGSLIIDYVVRVPAVVATPSIKAAAVAAVADPTTVGLPHGIMTIELSDENGEPVIASAATQDAYKSYAFVASGACPATPCPVLCGASETTMDDIYSCIEDGVPTNVSLCVASLGPVPTSSTLCCAATDSCRSAQTISPREPEPEPQAFLPQPEPEPAAPIQDGENVQEVAPGIRPESGHADHFGLTGGIVIPLVGVAASMTVIGYLVWMVRQKKKRSHDYVEKVQLPKVLTYDEFLKRMGLFDRKAALTSLLTPGRELVQLTDMDEAQLEETIIDDFELDLDGDEKEKFREAVRELWADERESDDEWDPVRVIWQSVDTDGSDSLGRDELREVLIQMGGTVTEEQLSNIMEQVDTNGSGVVEFDEFERWWTSQGQHKFATAGVSSDLSTDHGSSAKEEGDNTFEDDKPATTKKKKKKKKKNHRALDNAAAVLAMGHGVPGSILSARQTGRFDDVQKNAGGGKSDGRGDGYYNPSRSFSVNADDTGHDHSSDGTDVLLAGQAEPQRKKKKRLNQAAAAVIAMRPPGPPPPPPSAQSFAAVQALLLQEDRDFTVPPAGAIVQMAAKKKKKKKKKKSSDG